MGLKPIPSCPPPRASLSLGQSETTSPGYTQAAPSRFSTKWGSNCFRAINFTSAMTSVVKCGFSWVFLLVACIAIPGGQLSTHRGPALLPQAWWTEQLCLVLRGLRKSNGITFYRCFITGNSQYVRLAQTEFLPLGPLIAPGAEEMIVILKGEGGSPPPPAPRERLLHTSTAPGALRMLAPPTFL